MKPSELLARPESWTQDREALSTRGARAYANDSDAYRWCLHGAVIKCAGRRPGAVDDMVEMLSEKIREQVPNEWGCVALHVWNDRPERTHAEVLALLKEVGL